MSQPQTEVDAWRGAADVLVDAMGLGPEQPEQVALVQVQQAAPDSVAPEPVQTTETTELVADDLPELPVFAPVDLDELDLDHDDDETVTSSVTAEDDPDEYADPETQKLRAELRKAQKALDNERSQRVASNTAKWRQKYKEMYPLAEVDSIEATSRRSFERAAVESHNKHYKVLEPHLKALQDARDKILDETRAEGKANANVAYGKALTGPGAAAAISGDHEAAVVESRKTSRSVEEHIRNMLRIEDKKREG